MAVPGLSEFNSWPHDQCPYGFPSSRKRARFTYFFDRQFASYHWTSIQANMLASLSKIKYIKHTLNI